MLNKNKETSALRRLIYGAGANAYGQITVIIIQLIGVPILLRFWGVELYGEWLVLSAIPSYLSMVDLGFSLSAANDMTAKVARGDQHGALVVFQSLSALVYTIIVVGLVLSFVIFSFLPFRSWMNLSILNESQVRWTLFLLAAGILVKLADGVNHAGFRSQGEYALHSFLNYSTYLLTHLSLWITAILGFSPAWGAFVIFVIRFTATGLIAITLFHRHNSLLPGFKFAKRDELKKLFKPAMANVAIPLAQGVNIQGLTLVISTMLNPVAVVTFSTIRTLTRFALQMVLSISHAFEPELAAAWGRKDNPTLVKLYTNNLRLGFWISLIVVLFLSITGRWILNLWTDGQVVMDSHLFNWLLLSALLSVLWYGGLNLLKAGNLHLKAAFWYVFSSLIAVLLAIIILYFTNQLSYLGIALVVMDGLMMAYVFKSAATLIGQQSSIIFLSMLNFKVLFQEIFTILRKNPLYKKE